MLVIYILTPSAFCIASALTSIVAPLVITSSTSKMFLFFKIEGLDSE